MSTKRIRIEVNTTGADDAATGAGRAGVPGGIARLVGLQVDYHADVPAGTDVVITSEVDGTVKTLLTLTDRNADLPMQKITEALVTPTGGAVANTENPNLGLPICQGSLVVDVAQADALTPAVTVIGLFEID